MAEFILKDMAERAGLAAEYVIASAATSREELGNPVYPPVMRLLNREGLDCSCKRARQLSSADYERYDALVEDPRSQTVGIAHADCPEDAAYLARLLRRNKPPKEILTVCYEPVTGSHVGPGALALFFTGKEGVRMA